ncbi:N-acetylmuramoyl-L-alanine amidase family protein [Luteolibacter soli]|uniref:N-acetylmuramoyl-L-alanine amidase n=1 Tax=Luteolibacter soli TaxID=3135280 RepID=A0ABU9AUY7_9BACT
MKANPKRILFAAVSALLALCSPLARAGTVMLDPGHGGRDSGATVDQAKESEIMLSFAKVLDAELKRKGYVTNLTRDTDELVPLNSKRQTIADVKPIIVLGLHLSSSKDPNERGIRIFRSPKTEDEKLLLEERELPDHLVKALSAIEPKQTVTTHRLGLPYLNTPKAILLELGFLTNAEDRKLITDPAYQQKLATVLAEAINELY